MHLETIRARAETAGRVPGCRARGPLASCLRPAATAFGNATVNPAINPVLEEMLRTGRVTDAAGAYRPLVGPMSPAGGELIREVFQSVKPDISVETGFAY